MSGDYKQTAFFSRGVSQNTAYGWMLMHLAGVRGAGYRTSYLPNYWGFMEPFIWGSVCWNWWGSKWNVPDHSSLSSCPQSQFPTQIVSLRAMVKLYQMQKTLSLYLYTCPSGMYINHILHVFGRHAWAWGLLEGFGNALFLQGINNEYRDTGNSGFSC